MPLAILIACSSSDGRTEPNTMTPKTGTRVSELAPQRGAPRLVLTKDRAAWLAGDHLVLTMLATKQKTSVPLADAHAIGVLGDDIAVATNALGKRAIVRFAPGDAKGKSIEGVMAVPNTGYGSIFAGGKPNELYIGGPRIGINRCRIDDRVVPIQTVDWSADEDATFTAAGAGRVAFAQGDSIVRLGPDSAREAFKSPIAAPVHLAAGPGDAMWATEREELVLLALDHGQAKVTKTVPLGGVAYHLASAGDFAAVIVATGTAAKMTSELVVVCADGKIRWRAKLPANEPRLVVAANADRVAVQAGDELHVWRASDGTP